jgi:hypothetical protein
MSNGGQTGQYTGAFKAEISKIKQEIYDSGGPNAVDYTLAVAGGAVKGAAGGVVDVVVGTAKMAKEVGSEAADVVNDLAVVTTGQELYHGNLSQLGDASSRPDFNYRECGDVRDGLASRGYRGLGAGEDRCGHHGGARGIGRCHAEFWR